MTSKAQKRRNKRIQREKRENGGVPAQNRQTATSLAYLAPLASNKPTAERRKRGKWADKSGQDRRNAPYVDLQPDMIGELLQSGKITQSQEQAARTFQELRAAYLAELEVPTYKSCLAGGQSGHDESDGNVEVIRAYKSLEDRIGRVKTATLRLECDKLQGDKPFDLSNLRYALDAVAGG